MANQAYVQADPRTGKDIYRIVLTGDYVKGQCLLCPFTANPKSLHGARVGRATHIRYAHWDVYEHILEADHAAYLDDGTVSYRRTLERAEARSSNSG